MALQNSRLIKRLYDTRVNENIRGYKMAPSDAVKEALDWVGREEVRRVKLDKEKRSQARLF